MTLIMQIVIRLYQKEVVNYAAGLTSSSPELSVHEPEVFEFRMPSKAVNDAA
jgi:hypothetical protein